MAIRNFGEGVGDKLAATSRRGSIWPNALIPLSESTIHPEHFSQVGQRCAVDRYFCDTQRASPPSVALDYWGRLRRRSHSPRAERIRVKPPSPPSAQSVQTKKKPPGDLAISP